MTNELTMKRSNLVLPVSGYELDHDEMCYVDGGGSIKTYWWGMRLHLSNSEANTLNTYLGAGYGAIGLAMAFFPEPTVSKAFAVAAFANAAAVSLAIQYSSGAKGINIDFSWLQWALLFTSPFNAGLLIAAGIRRA